MIDSWNFLFAGGGSPGLIFPGLAVAHELRKLAPSARIRFVGEGQAFDRAEVERARFEYQGLSGVAPQTAWPSLRYVSKCIERRKSTSRLFDNSQPTVVVALGGRGTEALGRAALARRLPLVVIESNAIASRSTAHLARGAQLVCGAFAELRLSLRADCPLRLTGVPLRPGFTRRDARRARSMAARKTRPRRLLLLSGTADDVSFNQQLPRALYKLGPRIRGWQVVHQAGPSQVAATRELYRKLAVSALVVPFVGDMPRVLQGTDLAICRPGGTGLAELAAARVPAVLVPRDRSEGDHQRANGRAFAAEGAARMADAREVEGRFDDYLAEVIAGLVDSPMQRAAMCEALGLRARPEAAWNVASMLVELAHEHQTRRAG